MWALAKFSLFLVAGLLGTILAQESHQVGNEVSDGIRMWQTILSQKFDFGSMKIHTPELKNFTMLKCETNGAPEATNAVVESFEIFFNSAAAVMNETQRRLDIAANDPHNGLNAAVAATCHWITFMDYFNKNITHSFNRCLNSAERGSIGLINTVSSAVVQYVCENNGKRVSELLTADGRECLTSSGPRLYDCMVASFSSNTTIFEKTELSDSVPKFPIVSLNTQACREFQDLQQCAVRVLRECRYTLPSSEMNALFNIVKTTSGCDDFLEI